MEYLMTYGWAILIIAVVLGALFQVGVFSGIGTPRAQPGNCQVVKVGTGITQTISLAGECQGQEPEYVASFTGYDSTVNDSVSGPLNQQAVTSITITAWVVPKNLVPCYENIAGVYTTSGTQLDIGTTCSPYQAIMRQDGSHGVGSTVYPLSTGVYYFVVGIWNGTSDTLTVYLNGVNPATSAGNGASGYTINRYTIGGYYSGMYAWNGTISNVQMYNTTLSASEIKALYLEGIGGAPIRPQNIIGWWPLNGNAQDYSGNNNAGKINGKVIYTSSWTSGYTQP